MPPSFLDRESTVAPLRYNRFLVPLAALAVHLSIGQVYAFSIFYAPLTRLIGIGHAPPGDWKLWQVKWTFYIAIAVLGLSAAVSGRWVERAGPRKSMFTAALCFSGGFIVSAVGIHFHQLWLLYLGYGVLGGCGLGIGYISPMSTLIQWFPDRPGMASGLVIMGFGGGALIAAPLSLKLMEHFKTATSNGVLETFVTLGVIYFMFMLSGVNTVRVPAAAWRAPERAAPVQSRPLAAQANVAVDVAWRTPQFWLLWGVLCMNVTAGLGISSEASPMIREMFSGRLTPAAAAGFVGLLGIFDTGGRFVWAAASDYIGRRNTYMVLFGLGIVLYSCVPSLGRLGSTVPFVAAFAVMLSMYGGGFAAIPAYVRDIFGSMHVSAIHGRLLTAWSVAGVLGPELATYIRQHQIESGVPKAQADSMTLHILCVPLLVGLLCNLALRAVSERALVRRP